MSRRGGAISSQKRELCRKSRKFLLRNCISYHREVRPDVLSGEVQIRGRRRSAWRNVERKVMQKEGRGGAAMDGMARQWMRF